MTRRVFVLVTILFFTQSFSANGQSWTPAKQDQVTIWLHDFVPVLTPSIAIGISVNGTSVWESGLGFSVPGQGILVTRDSIFQIGSVSKQFTAAAILALAEDGARNFYTNRPFTLDDKVSEFFDNVEGWGNLTVRQLLTMTSGLPNFTSVPPPHSPPPPDFQPGGPVPWQVLLKAFKSYARNPIPSYSYSNTNYFLLAAIIESLIPTSPPYLGDYSNYLKWRIFYRAGMIETDLISETHGGAIPAFPTLKHPRLFADPDWPKGAGMIASSVSDMLKWDRALIAGKVIGADSLKQMFAAAVPTDRPGVFYGMGWKLLPTPGLQQFFHDGDISGFTAFNSIVRRESDNTTICVVLLTNADDVQGLEQLAGKIADLVFD
jgi:D-alanyl-D-alanine carboxypeptidase